MSTKTQRTRVILALDCLASQAEWTLWIYNLLGRCNDDSELVDAAYASASERLDEDFDSERWRVVYAEAAQLIREGTVK